jgi:hypothetical protein
MNKQLETKEELTKELSFCESRLKELKGKSVSPDFERELNELDGELKTCKLELNELEGKSGDEWEDTKNSVTRRLRDMKNNLQLSQRHVTGFLR